MHPFTSRPEESVAALGENALIASIRRWLGASCPPAPFGIGDDCALVPASRHPQLVTVDPVIYGEHFDDTLPARAAGAKLLKRNLSDIAAMGGRPRAAVIALALDQRVKTTWLADFYRGVASVARRYQVPVVGGDLARLSGGIVATLTLVGHAAARRPLTRQGGRIGDRIYVTGSLGGSRGGHHWRFTPRLEEGAWLAAQPEVRALMDVSDGLAKDIHALTPSASRPWLESACIPISPAAKREARRSGRSALAHALGDGEDYELLFAVSSRTDPDKFERAWKRRFRLPLTCIGHFARTEHPVPGHMVDLREHHGYEHLR